MGLHLALDTKARFQVSHIGVIGGSAFSFGEDMIDETERPVDTPYGPPSSTLRLGRVGGVVPVAVLARHGAGHSILPHEINYRANLWALRETCVRVVIALATVGGIGSENTPGTIVIPDQILDYTHSRDHTFSPLEGGLFHIDFTEPYCRELRLVILDRAAGMGMEVVPKGTYAATQGPRFESAAEIRRLARDGADVVGMTGMPEAALAREIGMCYATIALVVNQAAGLGGSRIRLDEIRDAYLRGMRNVNRLLSAAVASLEGFECRVPAPIVP